MVKGVYFLEFKVRLPNGKSETRRVEFDRQAQLMAFFEKAFSVKLKDHELGPQIAMIDGQKSSYYHFALVDKRTGKKYLPYAEDKDGKRIYLDLRHIMATREFAQNMAIEVFLVFDHRAQDNTVTTRYEGVHATFQLDEFTSADLRMADLGRMMRKYYLGNVGEDYRFHFLQLRARMLADSVGKMKGIPSPVFSFDGVAFSFSLPAKAARDDAPAAASEIFYSTPEPMMMLESQSWFDAATGGRVVQESVPALLAQVQVLAESLAVAEFPVAAKTQAQEFAAMKVPRAQKISMQAGSPLAMHAAGISATENSLETNRADPKAEIYSEGSSKDEGARDSGNRKTHANDEEKGSDSRGKGAKKKAPTKPVPFSALSSFKAAIFDLDGVIVDSEMVHPRTFERALAKYGVKIDNAHWKRAYTGIGSYAIFDDLVKKYGIKEDARELVKKRNGIYLAEIKRNRLPVIEGFAEVHKLLVENGVLEAVASGGHTNHVEESMRSAGLRNVPFVSIEMVKRGKPAPEIFLRAAKRLRVKPSECVVFEDSLSGMEAAARAGMPCVALSTTIPVKELKGRAALIVRNFKSKKLRKALAVLLRRREKGAKKGNARGVKGRRRKLRSRRR